MCVFTQSLHYGQDVTHSQFLSGVQLVWNRIVNVILYDDNRYAKRASCHRCTKLRLGGWVSGFYGVSTFVGYLTPNSVYIYIHSTKDFWTDT